MQTEPTDRDETGALHSAIAECGAGPVILVWIRHRPRVTTMRPLAESLAQKGYDVFVAYSTTLNTTPADMGFEDDLPCFRLRPENLRTLKNVAIVITSEQDTRDAPPEARRVGIHHSLPDYTFKTNYAKALVMHPVWAIETDYYAVLSTQTENHWTVENYLPHVDRQVPAVMLEHRRPSMAIIPFGYPKIDRMMALDTDGDTLDTITFAPTQSILPYSSVKEHGARIIGMLLRSFPGYRVAFRPYPGADVQRTRKAYERHLDNPRFSLDTTPTGEALMRRSAALVTDRSSVAMSFGLGFARPVLFFETLAKQKPDAKRIQYVAPIGLRVTNVPALKEAVARVLKNSPRIKDRINAQRGNFIYNPGGSIDYLADIIPDILADGTRPEWLEIPRRPFTGRTPAEMRAQYDALIAKVAASHPSGVKAAENALGWAFDPTPKRFFRSTARRIAQRIPGLRRYRSHPRDPS